MEEIHHMNTSVHLDWHYFMPIRILLLFNNLPKHKTGDQDKKIQISQTLNKELCLASSCRIFWFKFDHLQIRIIMLIVFCHEFNIVY